MHARKVNGKRETMSKIRLPDFDETSWISPIDLDTRYSIFLSLIVNYQPARNSSLGIEADETVSREQPVNWKCMPFQLPISKSHSHSGRSILMDRMAKINVLICASGSVAALKIPEICVELSADDSIDFRIVCSEASLHFLRNSAKYNPYVWSQFESCGGMSLVFTDDDEWRLWSAIGDPVLHVELSKWAHILVVAPASADIIAKIHAGIADSLLLCVVRAWNISKPCLLCPAMNTVMWNQHVTGKELLQINIIKI